MGEIFRFLKHIYAIYCINIFEETKYLAFLVKNPQNMANASKCDGSTFAYFRYQFLVMLVSNTEIIIHRCNLQLPPPFITYYLNQPAKGKYLWSIAIFDFVVCIHLEHIMAMVSYACIYFA